MSEEVKQEEQVVEQKQEPVVTVPKIVIAARLVIFAAVMVWVFGWLAVGFQLLPALFPTIEAGRLQDADPWQVFMFIWYVATFIVVGSLVAIKGFSFVGKWER